MKKRILFFSFIIVLMVLPVYGKRPPIRAVLFHKHVEEGNKRYGSGLNLYYLHGVMERNDKLSVTVLVERDVYMNSKIGDTLLIHYNKLLDKTTYIGIKPQIQATVEIEDRSIYIEN